MGGEAPEVGFCSKGRRAVRRPVCLIQASVLPAIPGAGKAGPPGAGPGKSGRRRRGLGWREKREEEEPRGGTRRRNPGKAGEEGGGNGQEEERKGERSGEETGRGWSPGEVRGEAGEGVG